MSGEDVSRWMYKLLLKTHWVIYLLPPYHFVPDTLHASTARFSCLNRQQQHILLDLHPSSTSASTSCSSQLTALRTLPSPTSSRTHTASRCIPRWSRRLSVFSSRSHRLSAMLDRPLLRGFLESAAGEWVLILSFVFGGCCSCVSATFLSIPSPHGALEAS